MQLTEQRLKDSPTVLVFVMQTFKDAMGYVQQSRCWCLKSETVPFALETCTIASKALKHPSWECVSVLTFFGTRTCWVTEWLKCRILIELTAGTWIQSDAYAIQNHAVWHCHYSLFTAWDRPYEVWSVRGSCPG